VIGRKFENWFVKEMFSVVLARKKIPLSPESETVNSCPAVPELGTTDITDCALLIFVKNKAISKVVMVFIFLVLFC
jgi:hypothetical protein